MPKLKDSEETTARLIVQDCRRQSARIMLMFALLFFSTVLTAQTVRVKAEQDARRGGQQETPANWKPVEKAMGRAGAMQPGEVLKFSMPRDDLRVTVKGVSVRPTLALGSWVAFKKMGNEAVVMGDLVLVENEVAPVMARLQQGGIEQSALHHHILYESPRVFYMHISGRGDPLKMAETISAALALTKTPPAPPGGISAAPDLGLDAKQIEEIIGHNGKINGGVFQISVPRAEKIMEGGMEIPPAMGVATALNFQPTGGGKAAVTGDFVLVASEVNGVMRALLGNGIEVTSLHNHMLTESPRLFFMHFWANDDVLKLARGLRAALDKTNSAQATTK
jgi:hypothetical protein